MSEPDIATLALVPMAIRSETHALRRPPGEATSVLASLPRQLGLQVRTSLDVLGAHQPLLTAATNSVSYKAQRPSGPDLN